jgi:hypothetical protein
MKTSFALYVDIDNIIAEPRWFHDDLETCKQSYSWDGTLIEVFIMMQAKHVRAGTTTDIWPKEPLI